MSTTQGTITARHLLTQEAAAKLLGLTNPATLACWRCNKTYDLPYVRVGRLIRYDLREIEKFIERRTVRSFGDAA